MFRASSRPSSGAYNCINSLWFYRWRESAGALLVVFWQITSLLLDVYVWLNMFRASPRTSSGAYNYTRSLWFYRWRESAGALLVVFWQITSLLLDVYVWLNMFRALPAHHQERTTTLGASGFTVGENRLERCWSCSGRSQVYYLTFMCGSTCFGPLSAHHQERTTALGASGFTVGENRLEQSYYRPGQALRVPGG